MGSPRTLILVDTSEVLKNGPRKLHAAWREVHDGKVVVPTTVGTELAPLAVPPDGLAGLSAAEHMLRDPGRRLSEARKFQLEKQAWWANVWRDDNSPYQLATLSDAQLSQKDKIASEIDAKCFRDAHAGNIAEHRDTQIICETLVLRGQILLTSNMRSIIHKEVNAWAVEKGEELGFPARPLLFHADEAIVEWTTDARERELWLQAGLIACWPRNDGAGAKEVVEKAISDIEKFTGDENAILHWSGTELVDGLKNHKDWESLVERTRTKLPSPTIETDRQHPTYPKRPAMPAPYRPSPNPKSWTR